MSDITLYNWSRLTGEPAGQAQFRAQIEDFRVTETLRFEPSGEGAHHLLFIEKINVNTDIVCHKLRRFADVKPLDIGYAGKKDRFAIARQWFSVQLPLLQEIDWQGFNDDEVKVLIATRHDKKLRIGAVKSNQFTIKLRNFSGNKDIIENKLKQIEQMGFPNYFGEQRFGHNGDNLARGLDLLKANKRLKNRNLQGLMFSAIRSAIFNDLLSKRIDQGLFNQLLDGDYVQLDGSESGFMVEDIAVEQARYDDKDIHPTASLVGRGRDKNSGQARDFEQKILNEYSDTIDKLATKGLSLDARVIRVFPNELQVSWSSENELELSFSLPKGAFATSLLRELVDLKVEKNDENIT